MQRLAIYTILVSLAATARAGWFTNGPSSCWPTTNGERFASMSNCVSTSFYAKAWTMVCSVSNSVIRGNVTNGIPGWTAAGGVYRMPDTAQQPDPFWLIITGETNWMQATSNGWREVGIASNSAFTFFATTNHYLTEITYNNPALTNFAASAATNINTYFLLTTTNAWASTNINQYDEMQIVSGHGTTTNLLLNRKDLWGLDLYLAAQERDAALAAICGSDYTATLTRPQYYRDTWDNLAGIKAWWGAAVLYFSNTNTDRTAYLAGVALPVFYPTVGQSWHDYAVFPRWATATGTLATAGLPANWLTYIPRRDIGGIRTASPGNVVTSTFTIAAAGSNVVTNSVSDYAGGSHTISGTNGQQFVFVCTNASVLPGYTEADYGYRWARNIFAPLALIEDPNIDTTETAFLGYWQTDPSGDWSNAVNQASAWGYGVRPSGYGKTIEEGAAGMKWWQLLFPLTINTYAQIFSRSGRVRPASYTNLPYQADAYLWATNGHAAFSGFGVQTLAYTSTVGYVQGWNCFTNNATIGTTTPMPWCPEPATPGLVGDVTTSGQGMEMRAGYGRAVVRYNFERQ